MLEITHINIWKQKKDQDEDEAFASAIADADHCIAVDDTCPKAWFRKGVGYLENGQPVCAKNVFELGLRRCPSDVELLERLSVSLRVIERESQESDIKKNNDFQSQCQPNYDALTVEMDDSEDLDCAIECMTARTSSTDMGNEIEPSSQSDCMDRTKHRRTDGAPAASTNGATARSTGHHRNDRSFIRTAGATMSVLQRSAERTATSLVPERLATRRARYTHSQQHALKASCGRIAISPRDSHGETAGNGLPEKATSSIAQRSVLRKLAKRRWANDPDSSDDE